MKPLILLLFVVLLSPIVPATQSYPFPPHFVYRLDMPDTADLVPLPQSPPAALRALSVHHMPPSALAATLHILLSKLEPHLTRTPPPLLKTPVVHIGDMAVPASRVTAVGDVDGNGHVDYVLSSPENGSGSARVYLMTGQGRYLYSRSLLPKGTSLPARARFGAIVHVLPNIWHVPGALLAIAAPGARAVHFILLSRRADLLRHVALRVSDVATVARSASAVWDPETLPADEADSSADDPDADDSDFLSLVRGTRAVLFQAADGELRAALRVDDGVNGEKLLHDVDRFVTAGALRRVAMVQPNVRAAMSSVLSQLDGFNATHCRCAQRERPIGGDCVQYMDTVQGEGVLCHITNTCEKRKVEFECDEMGASYCRRTVTPREAYVFDGVRDGAAGVVYCHRESFQNEGVMRIL